MAPLRRSSRRPIPLVIVSALGLVAFIYLTSLAFAHSWYPMACCHDHDCMPVEKAERLPDGSIRMRTGDIEVLVPKGFTQMPSQDNNMHMCVFRGRNGSWQPRCIFMPAGV